MLKHWIEVGESYGRVGTRIEGTKGDKSPTGRPIEPTNLESWELSKIEPPTKEHVQVSTLVLMQ